MSMNCKKTKRPWREKPQRSLRSCASRIRLRLSRVRGNDYSGRRIPLCLMGEMLLGRRVMLSSTRTSRTTDMLRKAPPSTASFAAVQLSAEECVVFERCTRLPPRSGLPRALARLVQPQIWPGHSRCSVWRRAVHAYPELSLSAKLSILLVHVL